MRCVGRSLSPSSAVSVETASLGGPSSGAPRANSLPRPTSPSPSVVSERAEADLQVVKLLGPCRSVFCQRYCTTLLLMYVTQYNILNKNKGIKMK